MDVDYVGPDRRKRERICVGPRWMETLAWAYLEMPWGGIGVIALCAIAILLSLYSSSTVGSLLTTLK